MNWNELHGDFFRSRRVLVTGAAGFIGSHLVEALVQLGASVVGFDDLSNGNWASLTGFDAGVEKVTGTILDKAALSRVTSGVDFVFHQAAMGSVPRSVAEPELYYHVNVTGTINVLEASKAAKVKRVMFAGSSSAYGDPPEDKIKVETMPPLPRSPYAATKLACEHAMRAWYHSYGLDTAVLRYFNIFGPRQNPNSAYAAVIAAFAKALHTGKTAQIFGDGSQSRDFTYVANAVHANLLAARSEHDVKGEVLNVATGRRVNLMELYWEMARLYSQPGKQPEYKPVRAGDVLHSQADITKIQRTLGYQVLVPFEQGLANTVAWYKQHFG
jgi:UDP-glucose 4-epimerase